MNFEFDFIIIIVGRLIKNVKFISFIKRTDADELTYIFLRWIISEYDLPEKLITDENKLFISKFWQSLIR